MVSEGVGYSSRMLSPAIALSPFIENYTIVTAPAPSTPDAHGVMFPLGYAMIEFNLGARWKKSPVQMEAAIDADEAGDVETLGSNITSFTQTPLRLQPTGPVRTAVARLHPLALRHLLGDDIRTNRVFDAQLVLGNGFREAEEKVATAKSIAAMKRCLDEYFLTVFRSPKIAVDSRVHEVWRQIVASGGTARLGKVIEVAGVSQKRMEQLFRTHFGMTPKAYSGIVRFQRILADYRPGQKLTTLAHATGYHDQSHFIRHFRSIAGTTPTDFFSTQCLHTCKISNLYNRTG